ncbi:MAG: hypothetical protein JWO31_4275 [Phycisphaerales bacterium]|nr:hypothetical protein [Phycisphaerales bacterium]
MPTRRNRAVQFQTDVTFLPDGQVEHRAALNLVEDEGGRMLSIHELGVAHALIRKHLDAAHAETAARATAGDGSLAGEFLKAYAAEMAVPYVPDDAEGEDDTAHMRIGPEVERPN